MAPVIDKLRKMKQKTRDAKPAAASADAAPPGASAKPRPKSQLARILGSAANRTFLGSSPRADASPVAVLPPPHARPDAMSLASSAEGYVAPHALPGLTVAACTSAGWHMLPDPAGAPEPVKARKKNQDAYSVQPFQAGLLAVVYDGHGAHGRLASQAVRDAVPPVLEACLEPCAGREISAEERRKIYAKAMTKAFLEAERVLRESDDIDDAYSGTTATAVFVDGGEVFVAWTGDSRCVMGNGTVGVDVTWDQKPTRMDEKKRVRASGGRVTRWKKNIGPQRVWLPDEWLPGLAMTRSIGDTVLTKYGVIPNPEMTVTKLGEGEEFVVVASDGVWEFMSSEEVIRFVGTAKADGDSEDEIARALVREAVKRWNENESVVDDITVIIMFIDGGKVTSRSESEMKRTMLRRKRQQVSNEDRVGTPWLVSNNGRLHSFNALNQVQDDDD